ncbi:MAG TPA: flagellar hook-basal body protein [Tepidisphaeraceae bacterium]|nr:flagellar hook-basal body protein [Tepidisphaeraceae bacterium]
MLYGLYLSASGVMAASHKQDVVANNIANVETAGFKRDLALFMERPTEAQAAGLGPSASHPMLERLGGGLLVAPTALDRTQGELEPTDSPLDVAIFGDGYLTVRDAQGRTRLTRDGRMMIDRGGNLVLPGGQPVLDDKGKPITLDPTQVATIADDGTVQQSGQPVARLGFAVVDRAVPLRKAGGNLLSVDDPAALRPATPNVRAGFLERSNVDPTLELTSLIETQRMLEFNAKMISYQDQTLGRLINEVGKIG